MKKGPVYLVCLMIPVFLVGCPGIGPVDPVPIDDGSHDNLIENEDVRPAPSVPFAFGGWWTSLWAVEPARPIEPTSETILPFVRSSAEELLSGYRLTAHWIVRYRDGTVAEIDGWHVLVGIITPDLQAEMGETINEIAYFISRDGEEWRYAGILLDPLDPEVAGEDIGRGSTWYDPELNRIYHFTTVMHENVFGLMADREITLTFATPIADETFLVFENIQHQGIIVSGSVGDPQIFRDIRSERDFLLWVDHQPMEDRVIADMIGLAICEAGDWADWRPMPPLLGVVGPIAGIGLPSMIYLDETYYLFFNLRLREQAGGLPDGLYGVYSANLRGPYYPLNGTGLVLTGPSIAGFEGIDWLAVPGPENSVKLLGNQRSIEEGTASSLIPWVILAVEADRTRLVEIGSPGSILGEFSQEF